MTIIAHQKKKLTFEEQIVHMKEKGISFQICSEESAIAYLKAKNNYYRLAAFRRISDSFATFFTLIRICDQRSCPWRSI